MRRKINQFIIYTYNIISTDDLQKKSEHKLLELVTNQTKISK